MLIDWISEVLVPYDQSIPSRPKSCSGVQSEERITKFFTVLGPYDIVRLRIHAPPSEEQLPGRSPGVSFFGLQ